MGSYAVFPSEIGSRIRMFKGANVSSLGLIFSTDRFFQQQLVDLIDLSECIRRLVTWLVLEFFNHATRTYGQEIKPLRCLNSEITAKPLNQWSARQIVCN